MGNNIKRICLYVILLVSAISSFGQGNYLGYRSDCLDTIKGQVKVCLQEVLGDQRYAEMSEVRQKEQTWVVLIKFDIDSTGKIITHTIHDKYSFLSEKEKSELDKKLLATHIDYCMADWYLREKTKEELFKLHNGILTFGVPFPSND